MTVHVVYPYDLKKIAAPWTIGNHLIEMATSRGHDVKAYDWQDGSTITPSSGDILIGHPHPSREFVLYNSWGGNWSKRYLICPFGGTSEYYAQVDPLITSCDHFFPLSGPYWSERLPDHWRIKSTPLDIAIDLSVFYPLKRSFNPIGCRGILNVGCTLPMKGSQYLSEIIKQVPGVNFGHLGHGVVCGAINFGHVADIRMAIHELVKIYDFIICPGSNDANPTVLIEFAAFGFVPISTPQAGWDERITNHIPYNNVSMAADIIKDLISAPEHHLIELNRKAQKFIHQYCTWKRFTDTMAKIVFNEG